jgi:hypothetical protein
MTEQIIAEVVLRAEDGSSIVSSAEPVTAESVERFKINAKQVLQAREHLLAYGFKVEAAGPFSFSISCEKEAFERVFKTELRAVTKEDSLIGNMTFYKVLSPIRIPEGLASFVSAVTLPVPPDLFP